MKTLSIMKHYKQRTNIKFLMLLLVMIIGYGVHPAFAAGENTKFMTDINSLINQFMDVAARARIPIATLAGKFMSNDMIYGSRFHLDQYLWQMWNISKNFANFGILGFLLYEVAQSVTSKKVNVQQILGKSIIAGIAIQMSWFLVGAIIDINTIATTAVGSFPASFLADSQAGNTMTKVIDSTIQKGVIVLNKDGAGKRDMTTGTRSTTDIKSNFMPKYDSVAGPLIFIGASALNIQDMMTSKQGEKVTAKSTLITFGLKGIILVFYVITLILLLIANVIRVGYLWVFIAISPIIILMAVFMKDKGLGAKGFLKELSLKNFISMTFKPTIFVAVMGVILIFIASIQSILLTDNPPELNGISISTKADTKETTIEVAGVASITTIDNVFSQAKGAGQSVIPNLIIYLATIFLLWFLVKLSLTSGGDPIAKVMESGTKFIQNAAETTPLMNGLGYKSMQKVSKDTLDKIGEGAGFENLGNRGSSERGKMENKDFEKKLRGWTGGTIEWGTRDIESLRETLKKPDGNFLEQTKTIIDNPDHEGLTGSSKFYPTWEAELKNWVQKDTSTTKLTKKYTDIKDLSEITSEADWEKIHEGLGGEAGKAPKSYQDFKKMKYGKTSE